MSKKRLDPEQINDRLREAEMGLSQDQTVDQGWRKPAPSSRVRCGCCPTIGCE